ncbi:hypothetical protein AB205_0113670 [Aquarana catesbeiana]|uniref:DDE Tnp4 domain-containing protein n=1 Tax=Aquarana catesbeiana TaxID=8400 RepID=A0A2G9REY4_AQUCT|nr:hypothetical protein AB205_0113670 [Aquarana catesbeiana]
MRPFPMRNLTPEQRIYNYRLSRARRVVENAFGILSSRFRLFLKAINLAEYKLNHVVLCCCILHNYLRRNASSYLASLSSEVDFAVSGLAESTVMTALESGRAGLPSQIAEMSGKSIWSTLWVEGQWLYSKMLPMWNKTII